MSDGRMLYWEQLAWLNGAKSENSEMVLQYIWPGCIRIPACCFTAKENDDYEKKKKGKNQVVVCSAYRLPVTIYHTCNSICC